MRDSQVLFDAVDKAVDLSKTVNLRAVLRGDPHLKKICVQVRIGVEERVSFAGISAPTESDFWPSFR